MKVAVLIKQTPDTAELPKVSAAEVQSGTVNATMVINPWDEFAAEEAVQLSENNDAETVAISLGNADSTDALKHALAMGVNEAILVDNSDLKGDMWTTASALAAALKSVGDVDLVLTGKHKVERLVDGGQETVESSLPAVISVAKEINEPRYPSFMGIRKASKAKIPVLSSDELGAVDGAKTHWVNIRKPEVKKTAVNALLAEKVI